MYQLLDLSAVSYSPEYEWKSLWWEWWWCECATLLLAESWLSFRSQRLMWLVRNLCQRPAEWNDFLAVLALVAWV